MGASKIYVGIGIASALLVTFLVYQMADVGKNENVENAGQSTIVNSTIKLAQVMQLPNVSGRIDHMDVDISGQRLFVAELGNNSVDVIDLKTGKRIGYINGLHEPQGIAYLPSSDEVFVANGGDGTVQIFDAKNYSLTKTISLSSDADNMHFDAYRKLVYVGYGSGGLAVIDPAKNVLIDTINLGGHPESFQILDDPQPRIFVNVPESNSIGVIDAQNGSVVAKWPNSGASGNYPMALDGYDHRLFTVYRSPSQLSVLDAQNGRQVAKLDVVNDADDIWYDAKNRQIYLTGGEGYLDVISQKDQNDYQEMAKISTGQGGRTSLFVPALDRLYVAVPDYLGSGAKIMVFETGKLA